MKHFEYDIEQYAHLIKQKQLKPSELVGQAIENINKVETKVQSFLTLQKEQALAAAKVLDELVPESLLFGLPVGIKDNIVTKDIRTTCASKMLENFYPIYDATVINKLATHQPIIIGKTNMDEFSMGSSTENSYFQLTRNPWDLTKVPGGSSGGSAAAVAAQEVLYALGSDTGGSIRQPAAYCGVVGMKPTYGRVSRYGLVAFASSLDQIGPITNTVKDNAIVLGAISGLDEMDATSSNKEVPSFTSELAKEIKGKKLALPKEFLGEGVMPEIKESILNAVKVFESLGATVEEVSLPNLKYSLAAYYLLSSSEASANLARFDGIRYGYQTENAKDLLDLYKRNRSEGFGEEVKRRIMLGTFALSANYYEAYYKKALKVRTLIKQDFDRVLNTYDCIIGPTTPTTAFGIEEQIKDQVSMYANDLLTIPVNLTGLPAISIPCGLVNQLPVGLQIIGKAFDEKTVYQVAYNFEQATINNRPKLNL